MNKTKCWFCEKDFEYEGEKYQDINCPHYGCGVLNSIYNPDKPDWKPETKPTTTQDEYLAKKEEKSVDSKKSGGEYRDKLHKRWKGLKGGFNSD